MKNTKRGFIVPLLIAIIAVLAIGGGVYLYTQNKSVDISVSSNSDKPVNRINQIGVTKQIKIPS